MSYYNIVTFSGEVAKRPDPMGSTFYPTEQQYCDAGWREVVGVEKPTDGYRVQAYGYRGNEDGKTCTKFVLSQINIAEEQAAKDAQQAALEAEWTAIQIQEEVRVNTVIIKTLIPLINDAILKQKALIIEDTLIALADTKAADIAAAGVKP